MPRGSLADTGLLVLGIVLILVVPFVFLRVVLGRRPFGHLPPGTVPRFVGLGFASALLAIVVNTVLDRLGLTGRLLGGLETGLPLGEALLVAFLLAGFVEEGAKLLLLRAGLRACPSHAALLVAGLLVGVGFGMVENATNVYAAAHMEMGRGVLSVAFIRSFVLLHPIATALAADGLGRRAFGPARWAGALWRGFGLAILVHGLWDLAVFWQPAGFWILQSLPFPWLIWWGGRVVSDRVLSLSGRAPARVAARRPPWVAATLVAFGLLHTEMIAQLVLTGAAASEVPILYGLELPVEAGRGILAYNLILSVAGLVGVVAAARRRRWGLPLYAAGASAGLLAELVVIALAAARGTLAFDAAELSDDLVAVASAALLLGAARAGVPGLARLGPRSRARRARPSAGTVAPRPDRRHHPRAGEAGAAWDDP